MKPKLLVTELWGLGDLVLGTPFFKAAVNQFDVVLLAKATALELQPRLWPGVEVVPFAFPWTAFSGKYRVFEWKWRDIAALMRKLRARRFDVAVSARPDPRDHLLLNMSGAERRVGLAQPWSSIFLTDWLPWPEVGTHRYDNWRTVGQRIGLELPPRAVAVTPVKGRRSILIHTGAAHPVRVWPLERYAGLAERLRRDGCQVEIACDPPQRQWWVSRGEKPAVPSSISELIALLDRVGLFFGNDSGPGNLAAVLGVPTFTIFGPQLPSLFTPIHPASEFIEGNPCPFKPCSDSCHFAQPDCMLSITEDAVWLRLKALVTKERLNGGA